MHLLALEGSVENADESNQGDEEEPPPKDEENLGQSFSNVTGIVIWGDQTDNWVIAPPNNYQL